MAPSGGLPSLDEFLRLTEAEVLAWSDTKVSQACFEYGLVAEGDDSGGQTLRERLVELLQSLAGKLPPSQHAVLSSPMGVGQAGTTAHFDANDGSLSSKSGLLHTPGGRFVTPPASPRRGGHTSGAPIVPFAEGECRPPHRDVNPLPFALDPEEPAVVDAMDSLAEGMVLTPGHDPYAHGSRSPSAEDLSSYDADMDDGDELQQSRTPLGPSKERHVFGGVARPFSPRRTRRQLSKRSAALRSPMGAGEGRAFSRQNNGATPARVRALPAAPFGIQPEHSATILDDIELADAATAVQTRSDHSTRDGDRATLHSDGGGNDVNDGDHVASGTEGARAAGPADQHEGISPSRDSNAHGLGGEFCTSLPLPQGPAVSPHRALPTGGIARHGGKEGEGLVSGQEAHQSEAPDPFRRVTVLGWARLAKIGGRPTLEELRTLKDEDLKAVIRRNGGRVANWWTRKNLLEWVPKWLAANPVR